MVIARELFVSYIILLIYLFTGRYILDFLGLSQETISISGEIILFLIALTMIFPTPQGVFGDSFEGEPLIVPLAIPAIAGLSCLTVLMSMTTTQPMLPLFIAISAVWFGTAVNLLTAAPLHRVLGRRGLTAIERLMGMLLVMMSVPPRNKPLSATNSSDPDRTYHGRVATRCFVSDVSVRTVAD